MVKIDKATGTINWMEVMREAVMMKCGEGPLKSRMNEHPRIFIDINEKIRTANSVETMPTRELAELSKGVSKTNRAEERKRTRTLQSKHPKRTKFNAEVGTSLEMEN